MTTRSGELGRACVDLVEAAKHVMAVAIGGPADCPRTETEIADGASLPSGEAPAYLGFAARLATAAIHAETVTATVEREAQRLFDTAMVAAELAAQRDRTAIEATTDATTADQALARNSS